MKAKSAAQSAVACARQQAGSAIALRRIQQRAFVPLGVAGAVGTNGLRRSKGTARNNRGGGFGQSVSDYGHSVRSAR
jgi:hypothetical protein